MFGHHDDNQQEDNPPVAPVQDTPQEPQDQPQPTDAVAPVTADVPAADQSDWQHPGAPLSNQVAPASDAASDQSTNEPISDVVSPAGGFPRSTDTQAASHFSPPSLAHDELSAPSLASDDTGANGDLIDIKQKALGELSPLLDQLDQPPEEKFRTLMMMIQASDDQNLVAAAYEAAHSIDDEKTRAQALLDIVNEINYFTSGQPEA